jgi:hypothetical protein
MDLVVAKVERAMNITWAKKIEGETSCHRNCIQHSYSKVLNAKKQTIVKIDGSQHKIRPLVRSPKSKKKSDGNPNYKRGKKLFYWHSKTDGIHWVS